MIQSARRIEVGADPVHQEIGTVDGMVAEGLRVRSAAGVFDARRAVSCLVEPGVGDLVLLAVPAAGPLYVLAVLERSDGAEPGVRVRVDGPLAIETEDRVTIKGRQQVAIETRRFDVKAGAARLALGAVELLATVADAKVEVAKLVADAVDVVSDRVLERVKRSYRFVEELDVTRARDIDTRAEQTIQVRGRNAVMSAEQLYKIDAEQVHLG